MQALARGAGPACYNRVCSLVACKLLQVLLSLKRCSFEVLNWCKTSIQCGMAETTTRNKEQSLSAGKTFLRYRRAATIAARDLAQQRKTKLLKVLSTEDGGNLCNACLRSFHFCNSQDACEGDAGCLPSTVGRIVSAYVSVSLIISSSRSAVTG